LYNTYSTLHTITSNTSSKVKMSLLAKADSGIDSAADFSGKKVGYSTSVDALATSSALAELNTAANMIEYVDSNDYYQLYDQLMDGEIQGLLIPNTRLNLLSEQYKDLETDTVVVAEYETTRSPVSTASSSLDISKEPFVVYIAGIDDGDDPAEDGRSDVNILLMVDPVNNSMTTVSIPRDSYVPNPALGNGSDKLTHLGNDGASNSILGLEEAFGIEIDYYAKVNFQSLIHIVDALGGIEVDVQLSFTEQDENRSFKKSDVITLEKGVQTLNGKQALAYARHRKTEGYGTTGRENAQQQIIKAIMAKLTTAEGISRINALMSVAQEYVATDIPIGAIQSFISKQLQDVKPWTVNSITLTGGADATLTTVSMPSMPLSCYLLSPDDLAKVYAAYMGMFEGAPDLAKFNFDLSTNPNCEIEYSQPQEISDYMITTADYASLNPYSVYYGVSRVDSSNAQASQSRAENYGVQIVYPTYVPVTPSLDEETVNEPTIEQPVEGTEGSGTETTEPAEPEVTVPDVPEVSETPDASATEASSEQ
jgi:LCP family protein required for cell wall assembly